MGITQAKKYLEQSNEFHTHEEQLQFVLQSIAESLIVIAYNISLKCQDD